jgi:FkbM family methyltransferase
LATLLTLQGRSTPGFYVDVGAHHPKRYSNTYLFYEAGWRGVNIDATPGSMRMFNQVRPRDINIEAAVANEIKLLTFYEFNDPALNGFSKEIADGRENYKGWKIIRERQIRTTTLVNLLSHYVQVGQVIDFLSVDVEGMDYEVLLSNDWSRFRPSVVLAEDGDAELGGMGADSKIVKYMTDIGYRWCCKTPLTLFFFDSEQFHKTPIGAQLKRLA